MDLNLAGKIALVTGSDRRTGSVIAEALKKECARVVIHSNDQQRPSEPLEVRGDLSNEGGRTRVLQELRQRELEPDILINNYGFTGGHDWQDTDEALWLEMYQVNVLSAIRLAQALAPAMKTKGWGRIIQLGTIGSEQPAAARPAYYAAKAALANASLSLAQELALSGVTVNTLSPGLIKTEDIVKLFNKIAKKRGWPTDWNELERIITNSEFPNLTGKLVEMQEVADYVCFLCSQSARSITGQNLRLDGGSVIHV